MFTCNNYNLLSFTFYLKYILAFNMTIIPFLYFYINLVNIIKSKKRLNKWFIKRRIKSIFYILVIFLLSLITHNMLNNNVCYVYATPNIYHEYKNSFNFLENKQIDNNIKNEYLNNILINKNNNSLEKLIYKEKVKEVATNNESNDNDNYNYYLHETDLNKQNMVYVENGVFYYPSYIYGNNSTYSGMYCPNNPQDNGYNNPYGYNNYFYTRLTKLIDDASKNGFKITLSTQGCRHYNTQVYYYNTMESGRAASPGFSLHGFGIASDLEFYNMDGSVCSGYRTDYTCPSMGWAHANAINYGLSFPLLNASYKEDWHIEPLNKMKY